MAESQACKLIKKETLAQVFSCELWEISKNTVFTEQLWTNCLNFSLRCWFSEAAFMFFKIGVVKNFAVLKPLSNKVASLPLQKTYGGGFWSFLAANLKFFLQLNMVLIGDSPSGFCSGLFWRHKLKLRSSHWSHCSVKNIFLENFQISQENTCVEVSF